jgi:A/G-specific adenine glycosylase
MDDSFLDNPSQRRTFARRLLAWFDRRARDLPWRRRRDPYAVWISEVMLQQTQVATVVNYFGRFLQAFPSLAALAAADEADVLRLWEGLGYYRRARGLHQAARRLRELGFDDVPDDPAVLAELPGLGRYTVNAILSQAFERPLPVLEANSRRVLCRLLAILEDPTSALAQKRLWQAADTLLPKRRVGDFNQALMELGALVCSPAPACAACPVTEHCAAKRRGLQARIPAPPKSPRVEQVREVAVAVRRRDKMLLLQRSDQGRWAGMWEFPRGAAPEGASPAQAARGLLDSLGIRAALGREIITIRHAVTRFRIALTCLEADYQGGRVHARGVQARGYRAARWLPLTELTSVPSSRPQRRLAAALRDA